ncbi:MAG: hypothetical protein LH473_02210 [Chitinophagales bacterium]|nr:hypothetical protein [Chitinophagales bacterium]
MKKTIFTLLFTAFIFTINAQNSIDEKANDFLRQSNSLYVVVSILVTIFAGLIFFLILQEKKISKLEKQINSKNS